MSQASAIFGCADAICGAATALSFADLAPGAAQALGGRLFRYGPMLCDLVAAALAEHPAQFPDIAISGPALLEKQARAVAWRELSGLLSRLAERANASYLAEQSGAISEALSVVRQVEAEARLPFPTGLPDRAARLLALHEPRRLLQRHRDKISAARRKGAPPRRPSRRAPSDLQAVLAERLFDDGSLKDRRAGARPAPKGSKRR